MSNICCNFARFLVQRYIMMRKKIHIVLLFIALAFVCSNMRTYAQDGTSCANPIVLSDGYTAYISGARTVWYIANTFDLPMAIDFYPNNPNSAAPELELDFSCTPGVYEDSVLCSLFCKSNSAYISMPHKETPPKGYDEQGNVRYHVEFGEFYRDMLLRQGIDYNVEVYIKVTYHGAGSLTMAPDPFNNCMDGHKFMHLGDTVNVKALDKDRHVIVPYVQWQYDSIRYVWTGTTPCTIAIGNKCGFDPTDNSDATIMDGGEIQPGGQFKVSSALLMQYVTDQVNYPNDAGMYFAKFYSTAPGVMKIEGIPAPPPAGGAIVLKYGTQTPISRNDTNTLYAMPDSWIKAMQFYTPTDHIFKMYIGATPGFYTKDAVATYQFDRMTDGHILSLMASDMTSIWSYKASGDNYMYVRFECTDNTTILPTLWTPSDCMTKAKRIEAGKQFDVPAKSNAIFSLFYADWKSGDMTIAWTSTQATCSFYIADTCDIPNSNVSPVFYTDKAPKKGSITIPMATVDSWEPNVDPDGYIYIRFYSQGKGKITVTTNAPEEEDPLCSPVDSVLTVSAWDSYTWRGTAYTQSGAYTMDGNVDPETGCVDTVFTLLLTIHTTSYDTYEQMGCDSVIYNGEKYTQTGVYTDTLFDAGGNRTVMTLNFTINHTTSSEMTLVECDSLYWNGEWYKESGDYTYTTTNAAGCDSTAYLHLTVGHSYEITLPAIKECDSYEWGDTTIYDSGTYTRHFKSLHGCDSIVTLTVTIGQSYLDTKDIITAYDSYTWIDGNTYTSSINGPVWELSTVDDCDSIITLDLTIRHLVTDTFVRELCPSELPYEWFGKYYTESGIYSSDTIQGKAVDGVYVDSVHTVNLTILPLTTGDTTATACESFKWHGKTYTESGDYTFLTTNKAGCDSTVTLYLTIYHATTGDTTATACDSFEWYGQTYEQSGEYNHTFDGGNIHGCDSVVTLHLTINHANSSEETRTEYESYEWNGVTYTESGNYTYETKNAAGCDSTATLHLTIKELPTFSYDTVYFCQGYNTEHEELISETQIRRYRKYRYESPAEWAYRDGLVVATQDHRIQLDLRHVEESLEAYYIGELEPIKKISWIYRKDGETALENLTSAAEPIWKDYGYLTIEVRFICGHVFAETIKAGSTEGVEDIDAADTSVRKILENGQIYILRGNTKYTIEGLKIEN